MIILFILGLVLGVFSVVFALQNTEVVTVTFFDWDLTGSLSLLIGLALLTGGLVALLIILPSSVSNYFKNRRLIKINSKLDDELKRQKEKTVFAKTVEPTEEDIAKIEEGVIDSKIL